eukprot:6098446-Amphidinium_carterae.1
MGTDRFLKKIPLVAMLFFFLSLCGQARSALFIIQDPALMSRYFDWNSLLSATAQHPGPVSHWCCTKPDTNFFTVFTSAYVVSELSPDAARVHQGFKRCG